MGESWAFGNRIEALATESCLLAYAAFCVLMPAPRPNLNSDTHSLKHDSTLNNSGMLDPSIY